MQLPVATGDKIREAVEALGNVGTGNGVGLVRQAWKWFKDRGIDDAEAQRLAQAAIDPAQLDNILAYIERRHGPGAAQSFLSFRREALIVPRMIGTMGAARAAEPEGQGLAPR